MSPEAVASPEPFRGELTDGATAALHSVLLTIDAGTLVGWRDPPRHDDDDSGPLVYWRLADLVVDPLDGGRARVTSTAVPGAAVTVDGIGGAALRAALPPRKRSLRRRRAILFYALGAVGLATLAYSRLDAVSRAVARRVPASYEAELGQGVSAILSRQYCETPAARAALDRVVGRLSDREDPPVDVHILDAAMINAFTLPGGTVVVTRGLIESAGGADELAGVVGHELEHVRRRHVMVHVVRSGLTTFLWQATVGDYAGLLIVDPRTAMNIVDLHFSRDDEREADRGALARLDRAGISRAGFRRFFERMQAKTDGVPAWLSNHPASAERMRLISGVGGPATGSAAPASSPSTASAASADDWKALVAGCATRP